jgi:protein TonB
VTRASSLWSGFGASLLVHIALGWQLYRAPLVLLAAPERDTFKVRILELPPPERKPEPPPEPEKPKPERPKPKPAPAKPPSEPSAAPPEAAPPERTPAEPASAPLALLAESGSATGAGVVQVPGAPIGAFVTTAALPAAPPKVVGAPRASASLAKLSDLSRKPRAPSLDAALRQNYPAELRRRGTEGQAEVRVVIDPRGRVGEIAVLSESATGFAEACRRTLLGSRWSEPLDRGGNPVSTRLTYRCRFQIER